MSSRKTHDGADKVYAAAQKWVDCALRSDGSLFTPGKQIWTSKGVGKLREQFLNQPDPGEGSFYDKLRQQLEGSPPEVYQLMGELLYVHFLIIWPASMRGDTKEDRINEVLGWSNQHVGVASDLVPALSAGIANMGAGVARYRPFYVGFLIEFVEQWNEQERGERDRLLKDPWAFREFVMTRQLGSRMFADYPVTPSAQRHALLHLVFPDTFEGVVSDGHKGLIAEAKTFQHFATGESGDVDRKIQKIRRGLKTGLGRDRDFDFYDPDVRSLWDLSASDAWDECVRVGSDFLNTGNMWSWELEYKYKIVGKLKAARDTVLNEAEDWPKLVKRSMTGIIVNFTQQDNFRRWIDESPDDALTALKALWADDESTVSERIRAFNSKYPRSVKSSTGGVGSRMNLFSHLLMGVDIERYPPFGITAFDSAYERTGYDKPPRGTDEAALYEHALGFLDRYINEAPVARGTRASPA